jgi:hypothetical protein
MCNIWPAGRIRLLHNLFLRREFIIFWRQKKVPYSSSFKKPASFVFILQKDYFWVQLFFRPLSQAQILHLTLLLKIIMIKNNAVVVTTEGIWSEFDMNVASVRLKWSIVTSWKKAVPYIALTMGQLKTILQRNWLCCYGWMEVPSAATDWPVWLVTIHNNCEQISSYRYMTRSHVTYGNTFNGTWE